MPSFFGGIAEGIGEDVRQVVPHEQRFVLVDGEAGMPLTRGEFEPHAPLCDTVPGDEGATLLVHAVARILQIDRIHRVRRHRHGDAQTRDVLFARVADDRRQASAGLRLVHAVEIDETHRIGRTVPVRHARAKTTGDEREVRIGVARLDGALRAGEFGPAIQAIVRVGGSLGKQLAKDVHIGTDARTLLRQSRGEALFKVAGRRVERVVQAPRKRVEGAGKCGSGAHANVDHVETRPRA